MPGRIHVVILLLAAAMGLAFASVSTYDFAQHLDRQMHELHCSFIPGQHGDAAAGETQGCQVTLMSPYSSVLRSMVWGGIPITLPAMAVFAFLLFRGVDLFGRRGRERRAAAGFLFAAAAIPVVASGVMGTIALVQLEAACKVCIGIYGASLVSLLAAGLCFASLRRAVDEEPDEASDGGAGKVWLMGLLQLAAFVAVPVLAYVALMPDYSRYVGTCGKLADSADPGGVMVPLDANAGAPVAIEVFDPLCPACRAFDRSVVDAKLDRKMHRMAVLFPLEQECNWMVEGAVHPGACTVSEAILCAQASNAVAPAQVIEWAFAQQDQIRVAGKTDPAAPKRMVLERFGELSSCLGSAEVQQRLNKSLRWAVDHHIPVSTPQLYVGGTKLCPEDTDLGLEYSLSRMLARQGGQP